MATTELIFKIRTDSADFKSTMAQVRSEITQTSRAQQAAAKTDLATRQQLALATFHQRRETRALVTQFLEQERAAKRLATGVQPVAQNLQRITDIMQTLGSTSATLQGPLGGVAGRLRSLGALSTEAAGGVGLLGAALGATIVGVAALAVGITKLTVVTADFQGKMFDLSQQTGVSVETLSALEILATTTGGSIDSITASLGIFQRNLEQAQDPTSKEAKLLKDLGVSALDTESALRQTLSRLAAMPAGFQQTSLALELFGRGGKQVLAILKEMDGDLDGAIKKFRAMGILIDTDTARAADKFNDQLALLTFQLRATAAIIGNEFMPTVLSALESFSKALEDNRESIMTWVGVFADAAQGAFFLAKHISGLIPLLQTIGNLSPKEGSTLATLFSMTPLGAGVSGLAKLGQLTQGPSSPFEGVTGGAGPPGISVPRRGRGGRGGGGRAPRDTSLQDAIKAAELTEREALLAINTDLEENKRALEEQARDIEEFTRRAIELEDLRLNTAIDRINKEQEAIEAAFQKKLISRQEFERRDRELTLETGEAVSENSQKVFELEQERDRKISQAHIAAKQRELQISDEADRRQIDRLEDRVDRELILESKAQQQIAAIVEDGFARRIKVLEDEQTQYATTLERRQAITDELIRLEGERADAAVRASQRIIDAQREEFLKRSDPERQGFPTTRPRSFEQEQLNILGSSRFVFEEFGKVMGDVFNVGAEQAQVFGDVLATTFGTVATAVGDAVKAFVLFGTVQGGFKRFAAEVVASIAQMAAVQAVFELAQGLAMLALAYFFPNIAYFKSAATHFAAAATFGLVAGAAAAAGRGIAGNSFAGEGGGESAGEPTATSEQQNRDRTRREGRQGGGSDPNAPIVVNVTVVGQATEGFKYMVENANVENYRRNGKFRGLIRTDVAGEAAG